MPPGPEPNIGVGTLRISDHARDLVMQVLDSGRLSYGRFARELEDRVAQLHGCRFGVLSNSGTSALHVAVGALKEMHGWADGDEVIVPAVTFVATVNVVIHNNLTPVLVDVDPIHYDLDPSLVEAAITERTRAMIPVHLFGQPCDMDPLMDIARRHDLRVIEDSCETMAARYGGRSVGSFGDIACFSTYVAHLLSTGVGGLNTTNSPEYAVKLRSLINHGRDSIYTSIDDDDNLGPERLRTVVERRFRFISAGHSFRTTELEAALGVAQLDEDFDESIRARRANAAFLSRALSHLEPRIQLPAIRPGSEHSFMMYPILLNEDPKDDFVMHLEQRGIETRDMMPLTNQPVYQDLLQLDESQFPVAQRINASGFYLGCHQHLTSSDLDYIVSVIDEYWNPDRKPGDRQSVLLIDALNIPGRPEDLPLERLPTQLFDRILVAAPGLPAATADRFRAINPDIEFLSTGDLGTALFDPDRGNRDIVIFPLDGGYDPDDIGRLLLSLQRGNDLVIGSRFTVGSGVRPGPLSQPRRIGNRFFTLFANLIFGGNLTDSLSQFKALRTDNFADLHLPSDRVAASYDLSLTALRRQLRVAESPSAERPSGGRSGGRTIRALASVPSLLRVLISNMLRGRPAGR
jgi:perosamine synthetase